MALREQIPEVMVPSRIIKLEELPRLRNDKIDKRALQLKDTAEPSFAPRAPTWNGSLQRSGKMSSNRDHCRLQRVSCRTAATLWALRWSFLGSEKTSVSPYRYQACSAPRRFDRSPPSSWWE